MKKIEKLLFTELRVLLRENENLSTREFSIEDALVDLENMEALGFTLSQASLIKLGADYASSYNIKPLYRRIMDFEEEIEVDPMYPNFPTQVLKMEEREYRINQFIHYLSTYGREQITGVPVEKGFLPEYEKEERLGKDERVVDLQFVDFLTKSEVEALVVNDLLGKKERLLPKESEIAKHIVLTSNLEITNIPFKENIAKIYAPALLEANPKEKAKLFKELKGILVHPGDLLDLLEEMVVLNRYKHFKTSTKRGLVKLLESFSYDSIEENLASNKWSNRFLGKKGKARKVNRNVALIDYLSFNRFSKNESIKKLVSDLKSGKLMSWNQTLEKSYSKGDMNRVIELLSQRPGMLFRQLNRLYKLNLPVSYLEDAIVKVAGKLKTQSIVSALNNFDSEDPKHNKEVRDLFKSALKANLAALPVNDLNGKNVYIDDSQYDLAQSRIELTNKFEEGGYVTNGLAFRIPENAKYVRFFTYWNDKERIDIDLHAVTLDKNGNITHVGFYGRSKTDQGMVHSGDITHSDAAEYIDINLDKEIENETQFAQFNLNSFTNVPFNKIDKVLCGVLLLSKMGEKVDLFQSQNVVFRHELKAKANSVNYANIDFQKRTVKIVGKQTMRRNDQEIDKLEVVLSIQEYLGILLESQKANIVDSKAKADIILGVGKSDEDKYYSLIDTNYFMQK